MISPKPELQNPKRKPLNRKSIDPKIQALGSPGLADVRAALQQVNASPPSSSTQSPSLDSFTLNLEPIPEP
jgi:hypothetical protein